MTDRYAVVLAAGQGTRMKSRKHKVLHPVCDKPMIQHVVDHLKGLQMKDIIVVIGHAAESVKEQLGDSVQYALQSEQLGTGHAVMQAQSFLEGKSGVTIVMYGDTPLVSPETIETLFQKHIEEKASCTVLSTFVDDPTGYGRIVRNNDGKIERIVEHKDASEKELEIREINTGIYCFDNEILWKYISRLSNDNQQGEYYIPDMVEICINEGFHVAIHVTEDHEETQGINNRVQLAQAEQILRRRIHKKHMLNGVTIIDPDTTYIGTDVSIGADTVIYPGTLIRGKCQIGENCEIGPYADITSSIIEDDVLIRHSTLSECIVQSGTTVGPYAHIRPGSRLGKEVRIGNFVEVKNSEMGDGSKASHLSYIGDAEVGDDVNVGCGVITVNYDGNKKHKTVIESHAFIGCNSNLIAPVKVGRGAYVAAGSTINKDIPADALAIARTRQTNKEDYAKRLRKK